MAKATKQTDGNRKAGKNKGEVSELYVFLVTLRDGEIRTTMKNEETGDDVSFVIRKVIGGASSSGCVYMVDEIDKTVFVEKDQMLIDTIRHETVANDTETVLKALKGKNVDGTLDFDTGEIVHRYHLKGISAGPSTKEDITLSLYDTRYGTMQTLPFSIKSFIGNNPTLINSSTDTNVIYRIEGNLTPDDVREINSMTVLKKDEQKANIQGRFDAIIEKGCTLKFDRIQGEVFSGNLELIDSALPEIIGALLIERYSTKEKNLGQLVEILKKKNPLGFKGEQDFYKVKICRMLMESFTGMVAKTPWNSYDSVHGGYIVVDKNGDVVCYPLNNRNVFEDYLLAHTYLETYSTSRSKFASIEKDLNGWIFKLNLDVRMKG